jgi:hypothetical protein
MLKFMNDDVTPPSGPSTRIPSEPSKRWYFHVPGAGKNRQRAVDVVSVVEIGAMAVMARQACTSPALVSRRAA